MTLVEYANKIESWSCKECHIKRNPSDSFFYCSSCDFKLCLDCANRCRKNEPENKNYIPNFTLPNRDW